MLLSALSNKSFCFRLKFYVTITTILHRKPIPQTYLSF